MFSVWSASPALAKKLTEACGYKNEGCGGGVTERKKESKLPLVIAKEVERKYGNTDHTHIHTHTDTRERGRALRSKFESSKLCCLIFFCFFCFYYLFYFLFLVSGVVALFLLLPPLFGLVVVSVLFFCCCCCCCCGVLLHFSSNGLDRSSDQDEREKGDGAVHGGYEEWGRRWRWRCWSKRDGARSTSCCAKTFVFLFILCWPPN